jgi:hypothetical protein
MQSASNVAAFFVGVTSLGAMPTSSLADSLRPHSRALPPAFECRSPASRAESRREPCLSSRAGAALDPAFAPGDAVRMMELFPSVQTARGPPLQRQPPRPAALLPAVSARVPIGSTVSATQLPVSAAYHSESVKELTRILVERFHCRLALQAAVARGAASPSDLEAFSLSRPHLVTTSPATATSPGDASTRRRPERAFSVAFAPSCSADGLASTGGTKSDQAAVQTPVDPFAVQLAAEAQEDIAALDGFRLARAAHSSPKLEPPMPPGRPLVAAGGATPGLPVINASRTAGMRRAHGVTSPAAAPGVCSFDSERSSAVSEATSKRLQQAGPIIITSPRPSATTTTTGPSEDSAAASATFATGIRRMLHGDVEPPSNADVVTSTPQHEGGAEMDAVERPVHHVVLELLRSRLSVLEGGVAAAAGAARLRDAPPARGPPAHSDPQPRGLGDQRLPTSSEIVMRDRHEAALYAQQASLEAALGRVAGVLKRTGAGGSTPPQTVVNVNAKAQTTNAPENSAANTTTRAVHAEAARSEQDPRSPRRTNAQSEGGSHTPPSRDAPRGTSLPAVSSLEGGRDRLAATHAVLARIEAAIGSHIQPGRVSLDRAGNAVAATESNELARHRTVGNAAPVGAPRGPQKLERSETNSAAGSPLVITGEGGLRAVASAGPAGTFNRTDGEASIVEESKPNKKHRHKSKHRKRDFADGSFGPDGPQEARADDMTLPFAEHSLKPSTTPRLLHQAGIAGVRRDDTGGGGLSPSRSPAEPTMEASGTGTLPSSSGSPRARPAVPNTLKWVPNARRAFERRQMEISGDAPDITTVTSDFVVPPAAAVPVTIKEPVYFPEEKKIAKALERVQSVLQAVHEKQSQISEYVESQVAELVASNVGVSRATAQRDADLELLLAEIPKEVAKREKYQAKLLALTSELDAVEEQCDIMRSGRGGQSRDDVVRQWAEYGLDSDSDEDGDGQRAQRRGDHEDGYDEDTALLSDDKRRRADFLRQLEDAAVMDDYTDVVTADFGVQVDIIVKSESLLGTNMDMSDPHSTPNMIIASLYRNELALHRTLENLSVAIANVAEFFRALEIDLTCKSCLATLSQPRSLLGCGHSFCAECCNGMSIGLEAIQCAECTHVSHVGYAPNATVEAIVSQWNSRGAGRDVTIVEELEDLRGSIMQAEDDVHSAYGALNAQSGASHSPPGAAGRRRSTHRKSQGPRKKSLTKGDEFQLNNIRDVIIHARVIVDDEFASRPREIPEDDEQYEPEGMVPDDL